MKYRNQYLIIISCLLMLMMSSSLTMAQNQDVDWQLENGTYQLEYAANGSVTLTEGEFEAEEERLFVTMLEDLTTYGDLDGDGLDDAVIVLVSNTGGSGNFYDMLALLNDGDEPLQVATEFLGDRIQINSLTIDEGEIVLDMVVQGPNDPFCCPSMAVTERYSLLVDETSETVTLLLESSTEEETEAQPISNSGLLFPYYDGDLYGYVNLQGELVLEPQYIAANQFSEGLAAVNPDGEGYGYINIQGQMVIEPQYAAAGPFSEGLAAVDQAAPDDEQSQYLFIDRQGNALTTETFELAASFSEGLAAVQLDGEYGFLNQQGELVLEPQFEYAHSFSEGLAGVAIDGQYGYIDRMGELVIAPQFDYGNLFFEGLAYVVIDDKTGYINQQGEFVIAPELEFGSNFSEGVALVEQDGAEMYIDRAGKVVIDSAEFVRGSSFSEGLAHVFTGDGDLAGYINQRGEVVIEPQFVTVTEFENGLAMVETAQHWGIINPAGEWLVQLDAPNYTESFGEPVEIQATLLYDFLPPVPQEVAEGSCMGNALNLAYAWRCMVGNQIYDLCLVGRDGETLVCGADPVDIEAGVTLRLSEPLPESDLPADIEPQTWQFQLTNGATCNFATGATIGIDDKRNNYFCNDGSTLFGEIDRSGDVWQIEKMEVGRDEEADMFIAESSEMVEIMAVWQPVDVEAVQDEIGLSLEDVTLEAEEIADTVSGQIRPRIVYNTEIPPMLNGEPPNLRFVLGEGNLAEYVYPNDRQLLIYPVAAYESLYAASPVETTFEEQLAQLQLLLDEQPETMTSTIPVWPDMGAVQVLQAQVEYLEFAEGTGVRFITTYAQDVSPVTNEALFYIFQGLTADGDYLVTFFHPLTTETLPATYDDSLAAEDYEAFAESYESYLAETTAALNEADDFAPELATLDAVIESLTVDAAE